MEFDYYETADIQHKKRERTHARKLRQSQWWKSQLAKGVCYYCKESFSPGELTLDHKVPVARGGKSNKGNVVPCCKACNTSKRHLTPAEMILNAWSK